jgi:3-hydroxybutyryl-CoA dehydrogenase
MGSGIAQVAAVAGYQVLLFDTRPEAVAKAIADIGKAYEKLVEKGRMGAAEADLARARLRRRALASCRMPRWWSKPSSKTWTSSASCSPSWKHRRRRLHPGHQHLVDLGHRHRRPAARPERLVGMHFFNPVPLMALVEVISGLATDKAVADTVYATAEAWGKNPVHAKSTPGFIVNRVARPFYAEALRLLQEQAADAATLDAVMRDAAASAWGPSS